MNERSCPRFSKNICRLIFNANQRVRDIPVVNVGTQNVDILEWYGKLRDAISGRMSQLHTDLSSSKIAK